jgi:aminocarboxymuconate-semialdehyde decarboxylase
VHDEKALRFILDLMGSDKICLGSDYPFPLGEAIPGELVRSAPISDIEKQKILGDSAKAWLGL